MIFAKCSCPSACNRWQYTNHSRNMRHLLSKELYYEWLTLPTVHITHLSKFPHPYCLANTEQVAPTELSRYSPLLNGACDADFCFTMSLLAHLMSGTMATILPKTESQECAIDTPNRWMKSSDLYMYFGNREPVAQLHFFWAHFCMHATYHVTPFCSDWILDALGLFPSSFLDSSRLPFSNCPYLSSNWGNSNPRPSGENVWGSENHDAVTASVPMFFPRPSLKRLRTCSAVALFA